MGGVLRVSITVKSFLNFLCVFCPKKLTFLKIIV